MTLETLERVLRPAMERGYAVAGLVCLGWEDARAYAMAAEAECAPVILQGGAGRAGAYADSGLGRDVPAPGRECLGARRRPSRPWLHPRRMPRGDRGGLFLGHV